MDMLKKIQNYLYWHLHINKLYEMLPDKKYIELRYRRQFGRDINWEKPQLFSEKIQWLKMNVRHTEYTRMVDKYEAKEYVSNIIGDKYITPTIGVWSDFEQIDLNALPERFVLKCTHNSGGLVICQNKSAVNWKKAKKQLNKSLKHDYFRSSREWPYKNVPRRIIAEEYLENDKDGLHDYKIWCFNGEPVYVQYITGRIGNQTYEGFYDLDWKLQNFSYHNPLLKEEVPRPACLEELISLARALAKGIPFVRTDFYVLQDGSIRFGEITFYPMSGMEHFNPENMDQIFGKMLDVYYEA